MFVEQFGGKQAPRISPHDWLTMRAASSWLSLSYLIFSCCQLPFCEFPKHTTAFHYRYDMQMYCTFVNQHFPGLPASGTHCVWYSFILKFLLKSWIGNISWFQENIMKPFPCYEVDSEIIKLLRYMWMRVPKKLEIHSASFKAIRFLQLCLSISLVFYLAYLSLSRLPFSLSLSLYISHTQTQTYTQTRARVPLPSGRLMLCIWNFS
jgi:hypothetical protein